MVVFGMEHMVLKVDSIGEARAAAMSVKKAARTATISAERLPVGKVFSESDES